ncbi:MAG: YicC family protein [Clostridia bacterium]|nr:YicC family protein [Clostridia bacterium]
MLKSMTGYGRGEELTASHKIVVEIKSVNNRYNDVNIKLPRAYAFMEENIRGEIAKYTTRGKIDVFVTIEQYNDDSKVVIADTQLAKKYVEAVRALSEETGVPFELNAGQLARVPDILTIDKGEEDKEKIWEDIKRILTLAGQQYVEMREREGNTISGVLKARADYIALIVDKITERMPEIVKEYRERLLGKIREVLDDKNIDESRILTEVAIFADKVSTDEETDRLKSHLKEFYSMIESEQPVGRRMDFLIQEMNRETNTIGSKCNDITVAKMVVEIKAEIEKIREQIQNIE